MKLKVETPNCHSCLRAYGKVKFIAVGTDKAVYCGNCGRRLLESQTASRWSYLFRRNYENT